ncbi:hypothetical protein [Methylotuvimicrobium sp. KM1]|uniref:hypothetical protein n=1 Tax=Methylotuvimicrobium sp. KM1 TaxID=3377707 RepID=UPI003850F29A
MPQQKTQSIDTASSNRFRIREHKRLTIPESIREEIRLGNAMKDYRPISPLEFAPYENAEGYEFSWGHILERRAGQYLVWDFCFNQLLGQYLSTGRRLNDLQRTVFFELERIVDCTTRDIVQVLSMRDGWKIMQCSTLGVFTLVIHFTEESEAREWVVDNLLNSVIPEIIGQLSASKPDHK